MSAVSGKFSKVPIEHYTAFEKLSALGKPTESWALSSIACRVSQFCKVSKLDYFRYKVQKLGSKFRSMGKGEISTVKVEINLKRGSWKFDFTPQNWTKKVHRTITFDNLQPCLLAQLRLRLLSQKFHLCNLVCCKIAFCGTVSFLMSLNIGLHGLCTL